MAAEQSWAGKTALTLIILATCGYLKRIHRVKEHAAMIHRSFLESGGHYVIKYVIFSSGSLPSLKERVPQEENSKGKQSGEGER